MAPILRNESAHEGRTPQRFKVCSFAKRCQAPKQRADKDHTAVGINCQVMHIDVKPIRADEIPKDAFEGKKLLEGDVQSY